MSKRITEEQYHELAKSRGFRFVGVYTGRVHDKVGWECGHGHTWKTACVNIREGKGCPYCAHCVRISEEQYNKLAESRGFAFIGPYPGRVNVKTTWRCVKGHEWEAVYNSVSGGTGCPFCSRNARKAKKDYFSLAEKRGFLWKRAELPKNVKAKTAWECKNGHVWETSYDSVRAGSGCPTCAIKANAETLRLKPEDYHKTAQKYGLVWMGTETYNTGTKTKWQCAKGHIWEAIYGSVQQGSGCPICAIGTRAEALRLKSVDYYRLAKEVGVTWLGPEVRNNQTKTNWKCKNGHAWESRYNDIYRGYGCPHCVNVVNGAKASQVQLDLAEMLGAEVNHSPDEVCYYIDCALLSDKIAVEYDGYYWHGSKAQEDYGRAMELVELGWRVLAIKAGNGLPSREQLDESIAQLETHPYIELILDDWGIGNTRGK